MKAYLLSTFTIFSLIAVAHVWRMIVESSALARDPFFVALTVAAAALAIWSFRLIRSLARS